MKKILYSIFLSCLFIQLNGQDDDVDVGGFYFGPKMGLTLGTQNWDGFERQPMVNYHLAVFAETLDPELRGSFYAQLGYHSRGSALRLRLVNLGGAFTNQAFIYRNASLGVGVKKRLEINSLHTPYYFVGVRGEYNISNNLRQVREEFSLGASSLFYPFEVYVRKFTYGLSFGGGFEFEGSDFMQPVIEFNISPDLNFQYISEDIGNVINPFNGQPVNLTERSIRNVTFEISLVLKFLREVIYVD